MKYMCPACDNHPCQCLKMQDGLSRASSDNSDLLAAVHCADLAMMDVVRLLQTAGDERWRELARLQTEFCAPLQAELSS